MRTAVDTNVVSAVWSRERRGAEMAALLGDARVMGRVTISAPVYVELRAYPHSTADAVDAFLADTGVAVDYEFGEAVWREAARAFSECARRRRASGGGQPKRMLADFVIGAHAPLDPARYSEAFPQLKIIP